MKKTIITTAAILAACLAMTATASAVNIPMNSRSRMTSAQQDAQRPGQTPAGIGTAAPFNTETGSIRISEPGDYILTGRMTGTVFVDPGYGKVNITFDGVSIDGQYGPAIAAISGERLNINIADGSVNYMGGAPNNTYGAVFYSDIPVEIGGNGRLDIISMGNDVFRVKDNDITFNGGDIRIQAAGYGIEAPNAVFNGGSVTVNSELGNVAPGTEVVIAGGSFTGYSSRITDSYTDTGSFSGGQSVDNSQFTGTTRQTTYDQFTGSSSQPSIDSQPTSNGQFTGSGSQPSGNTQFTGGAQASGSGQFSGGNQPSDNSQFGGGQPFNGGAQGNSGQPSTNTAGEVAEGITENSAMSLTADYDNAVTYDVSEESTVKITSSGTYIVTGSAEEGSITVKKGTTGVVLVLQDLNLASSTGAVLSINKQAEVQVIVSGNVTLTDNENPDDENSEDADVADAYDGAAIKIKADSVAFITGDGTLNINGNAKNGIKAGDNTSLIIGGDITLNIEAVNDGINGNYDITILSGNVNVSAGDDGIHADHILTIGDSVTGTGPVLTIKNSTEGLEGSVVNITGGNITVRASDDGINAANGDGTYEGTLGYSINITGGTTNVNAGTDGLDSNGNINLINGSLTIRSANNGGDAGIDYDGEYYVSDSFGLNNASGVAGPDMMPGQMGGDMQGNMPGQMGGDMPGGMNGMRR